MTRNEIRTQQVLANGLLGLAAHYRISGWSYKDALARAEELLPTTGRMLTPEWHDQFWAQVDADMERRDPYGHGES